MSDWKPIESVPRDGSTIDIFIGNSRETEVRWGRPQHSCGEAGRYCDCCPTYDGWVSAHCEYYLSGEEGLYDEEPTHWMPLPAPPTTTNTNLGEQG